ncbi:hypothetical protein SMD44_08524 [Streptomyces alboflavus]|uniref:Uncharacterized protein n=1 Tax=Streptomyces alboflavus TaxID=67267 RepID=A0A1Z1WRL1_9ACTN|nr:hypothetical protein SMD44_08524 [Streptomyces alboflavus]
MWPGSRRLRFRDALAHFEEGLLGDVLRAERDDEVGRLGGVLADQAAGPDEGAVQAEPLEEEVKVEQVGGAQEPEGLGDGGTDMRFPRGTLDVGRRPDRGPLEPCVGQKRVTGVVGELSQGDGERGDRRARETLGEA